MAVIRHHRKNEPPDRTPMSVRIAVSATDDYSGGVRGVWERVRSLTTGLGITARRAAEKPGTLRYPYEKLDMTDSWRGALHLTGILGHDEPPVLTAEPQEHNALVENAALDAALPPCMGACPANVDARSQAFLFGAGRTAEAYELVRSRNVMPGVLGRICHHPCESACTRNRYDEPIAIRPLHRAVSEAYDPMREERNQPLPVTREERVAIVGSGPSGLAAALDLMSSGFEVHMFEKDREPGGALRTGVPSYRLPRDLLSSEITDLQRLGMRLFTGVTIGVDVPIDHLIGEYDAVLIAAGLQKSRILPLPGADFLGVRGALEFLRAGNCGGDPAVEGKRVLIVGGGNVAIDCARVALRFGASEVMLSSLESYDEMPAHRWEIEEAEEEGVRILCSRGPVEVLGDDDRVAGMRLKTCLSVFDVHGRFSPTFSDEMTDIECDVIVFAVGHAPDLRTLVGGSDLLLTEQGWLQVNGALLTTSVASVFACGEVVIGPNSAIGSISSGHEAAVSIIRYLNGMSADGDRTFRPVQPPIHHPSVDLTDVEPERRRAVMPMEPGLSRRHDFRQVELGMSNEEALREARRCLQCASGVCSLCTFCERTCPDFAIQVDRDALITGGEAYKLDLSLCSFCGLCAEQCPSGALCHTGQYEMSFYTRDLMSFDTCQMLRSAEPTRVTGTEGGMSGVAAQPERTDA